MHSILMGSYHPVCREFGQSAFKSAGGCPTLHAIQALHGAWATSSRARHGGDVRLGHVHQEVTPCIEQMALLSFKRSQSVACADMDATTLASRQHIVSGRVYQVGGAKARAALE
jgi:hypothetical protein